MLSACFGAGTADVHWSFLPVIELADILQCFSSVPNAQAVLPVELFSASLF